jgi:hypothetical protein
MHWLTAAMLYRLKLNPHPLKGSRRAIIRRMHNTNLEMPMTRAIMTYKWHDDKVQALF